MAVDATTSILERALDMRMKAHEVHTSNIANANVPNYRAKKLAFEAAMNQAVHQQGGAKTRIEQEEQVLKALQGVEAEVYEDPTSPMKSNGNTVDMEREQTELAKNTLAYQAAIQMLNKKFAMAKYAVTEGGRK